MIATPLPSLPEPSESDETAWLEAMAELASLRRVAELDCDHLAEFLSDLAKCDRREVWSRLRSLIAHLLKWTHQPAKRSRSWRSTIEAQRQELRQLLKSRTLRSHAEEVLPEAYVDGMKLTAVENGLPESTFPADSHFTLGQIETEWTIADEALADNGD